MPRKKSSSTTAESPSSDPLAADTDPNEAAGWQYGAIRSYGLEVEYLERKQAYAVLGELKRNVPVENVARGHELRRWQKVGPTKGQVGYMESLGLPWKRARNIREAGLLLDAHLEPLKLYKKLMREIDKAGNAAELDAAKRDLALVLDILPRQHVEALFEAGKEQRARVGTVGDEIPE